MRIKALSAFTAGRSEHKKLMQKAFLILTKKCAEGVQQGGLGCLGISCLLFIPTQCLRIRFSP